MILRIEEQETKIFQTKTKTNFTLTFQLVKPEEFLMRNTYPLSDNIEKKIKSKSSKIIKDLVRVNQTPRSKLANHLKIKGNKMKKENDMRQTIQNLIRESTKDMKSLNEELNLKEGADDLHILSKEKAEKIYENQTLLDNFGNGIFAGQNNLDDSLMLDRKRANTTDFFDLYSVRNGSFVIPLGVTKGQSDLMTDVMIKEGIISKNKR